MSVIWDTEALAALVETVESRARYSERASGRFLQRLMAAADMLDGFPQIGRIVPEYGLPQIRELIVERVRLIYRLGPDHVEVPTAIPMGNQ